LYRAKLKKRKMQMLERFESMSVTAHNITLPKCRSIIIAIFEIVQCGTSASYKTLGTMHTSVNEME
jgi:hypothetical protein